MDVHGVPFDASTIGSAPEFLKWLQDHPLTRFKDGMYALVGMLMIMEGRERKSANNRKNYLIEQVLSHPNLEGLKKSEAPSDVKFKFEI